MYHDVEKFRSTGSTSPKISITKDSFRLNSAAQKEFAIAGYTHAKLRQHNDDDMKLAIKLLHAPEKTANKFTSGTLVAKSQIASLKLAKGECDVTFDENEAMLEFVAKEAKNDIAEAKAPRQQQKKAA